MTLIICKDCGNELSADKVRCVYCGTVKALSPFKIYVHTCHKCFKQFSADKARCPYCKSRIDISYTKIFIAIVALLVVNFILFILNNAFGSVAFMALCGLFWVLYLGAMKEILEKQKEAEQIAEKRLKEQNLAKTVIEQHIVTLARKKKQLFITDEYGVIDPEPWLNEIERFNTRVLEPQSQMDKPLAISSVQIIIEDLIEEYLRKGTLPSVEFSEAMNPFDYERFCGNLLSDIGWSVQVTKASGDQGCDVIAEKSGIKIVLQCKLYTQPVGNKAVQEIFAAKTHEQANHAAVVTNQDFTRSARQIGATTGIALLHHDQVQDWAKTLA